VDVEIAEERIIVLADRFNLDYAEGRAWAKRADAFGTVARLGGLLNRTGSDDYECVYRERRLQPFCTAAPSPDTSAAGRTPCRWRRTS
jgi:hypothetical protein